MNHDAHLADTREHVDGRTKVSDVEDWKCELDVPVMSDTLGRIFATGLTRRAFIIGTLRNQVSVDAV